MAREMDSRGEWERLSGRYREMTDGQLLEMAEGIGNLTEAAAEVLRQELGVRRLQVPDGDEIAARPGFKAAESAASRNSPQSGALNTFYDAFDAGRACEFLEAEGIEFELRDVSGPSSGLGTFDGGPAVVLQLFVDGADRLRAMSVLRKKMGLFPLQEVEVADEAVDDGTLTAVGYFGQREDAEQVAGILEEAAVWHRIVANPEGTVEDENRFALEVREVDLARAGQVVEEAMEGLE